MENGIWPGYISDKIIDAILCRAIPIYVGAPDVLEYIPFALILNNYTNSHIARENVNGIITCTRPQPIVEQMDEWVQMYAEEYTIYSKIKQVVSGQCISE